MAKRRVVITGLGVISPCGAGWQPYWEALVHGRSHIRTIQSMSLNGFPSKFAGEIPDFDPRGYVKQRKSLKVMSREIQLAVAASQLAVEDAGLVISEEDKDHIGICLGTGIINNDLDEVGIGIRNGMDDEGKFDMAKFGQAGIRSLYPLWFLKYLPNMPACHISIAHGLRGPSNTITTSSASAAQAIGDAYRTLERGDADVMIAGGTDSKINAYGMGRFEMLGLLSRRNHTPQDAYCPFDQKHDGIIVGEGAGLIILEERERALRRGAQIYAELIGYGVSSDFNPDPRQTTDTMGKCIAMKTALKDAGIHNRDVSFVVANGSGIPCQDIQEAIALREVFEHAENGLRVTALKPITGHLVYASGGVEMTGTVMALREGIIPPLINLKNPHPECSLPFVTDEFQPCDGDIALFNSFGFGAQNVSLVMRRGEFS
ncbi:MAG: beta-ketoacyl-[acyl-carrier-protein] synthase family protein [Candidatus Omnitrophota bacterium]|nr:beta-ketoacyl-[acyl-carrier-protein] synthase family protein [Candidatus Omnitrophota bacterium]